MITRIRDVRRAKNLTLAEVAARCKPPTTAQTIGRLETGTRTVSVGWLNRIAAALEVEAADLVQLPEMVDLPVVAVLNSGGVAAPRQPSIVTPPRPDPGMVAMRVEVGTGDYRAGDTVWMQRLAPESFGQALNRDVLLPRPAGRFLFGRLIGREPGKLQLLPFAGGGRQQVLADPAWIGVATRLVRALG